MLKKKKATSALTVVQEWTERSRTMAEYIKRKDAVKKIIANILYEEPPYTDSALAINRWVADQMADVPSIDIVFCKDCKYYEPRTDHTGLCGWHKTSGYNFGVAVIDYCSQGKRKEQEHEFFKK